MKTILTLLGLLIIIVAIVFSPFIYADPTIIPAIAISVVIAIAIAAVTFAAIHLLFKIGWLK